MNCFFSTKFGRCSAIILKIFFHFFCLFCLSNYTYFRQLDMPSVFTEALFIFSKFMFFSCFLSIEFSQSLLPSLICYKTSPDFFFISEILFSSIDIYLVLFYCCYFLLRLSFCIFIIITFPFDSLSIFIVDALKTLSSLFNI